MFPSIGSVNTGLIPITPQSTFTRDSLLGDNWTGLSWSWDGFNTSAHQSSLSLSNIADSSTPRTVQIQTDGTSTVIINGKTYTGDVTLSGPNLSNLSVVAGSNITFDAVQYLASYPDLIRAFGYDLDAATRHYFTRGITEGRSADSFDEVRYLASNLDLVSAFGNNLAAATRHYIEHGYAEGRIV